MTRPYLKHHWENLTRALPEIKQRFFEEIVALYNSPGRYYHNLHHIEALLKLSDQHSELLRSPKIVNFTIWYHDTIYNVLKNDNEKRSAELAMNHLAEMGLEQQTIDECAQLIIATKDHELPKNYGSFDTRFLLDIDLSILAAPQQAYLEYTEQIRKEYNIYPDFLYKKGRKKVLTHFLKMDKIYKTGLFQNLWEAQARENLDQELSILQ